MRSALLLALCLVCAAGLLTSVVGADIPLGQACGNDDTCTTGNICIANVCIPEVLAGVLINGQNNACSATDCCDTGLTCFSLPDGSTTTQFQQLCLPNDTPVTTGFSTVTCTGSPGSGGTPTEASTGTDNTPTTVASTGAFGLGAVCSSEDTCDSGLICLANFCRPSSSAGGAINGLGDLCQSNLCCPSGLVCYQSLGRCAPEVDGIATIACTGQEPTGPSVPSLNGTECGNTEACADDLVCITNVCVTQAAAGSGAINALGNECTASNCCPNGLACISPFGVCTLQYPAFSYTTCTATGTLSSGQTVGPAGTTTSPTVTSSTSTGASSGGGTTTTTGTIGSNDADSRSTPFMMVGIVAITACMQAIGQAW